MDWTPERILEKTEPDTNGGCLLWFGWLNDDGYGRIQDGPRRTGAHRKMYELLNGPISDDLVVMHKCDVSCCVNPAHLTLGTQLENIQDRHKKGRSSNAMGRKGNACNWAKLTESDVRWIRFRLEAGESHTKIAGEYDISRSAVTMIKNRKNWKHI